MENPVTIVVNKPADIPHVSQVIVSFVWRKIYRLLILILLHVVSKIVARVYEWLKFFYVSILKKNKSSKKNVNTISDVK